MSTQEQAAIPVNLTDDVSLRRFLLDLVSRLERSSARIDELETRVKQLSTKP